MYKKLFPLLFVVVASACGGGATGQQETSVSESEKLLREVIEGHDVAMPKMKKMERLQQEAKSAVDSIAGLPVAKQRASANYKARLDSALTALTYASDAMNEWMGGFKYDSFSNNEPERIKYLQAEKEKVTRMKDTVLGSLKRAEAVLGE
ncbi:MAG: viral A-type inclusion protein [Niabella sp.]